MKTTLLMLGLLACCQFAQAQWLPVSPEIAKQKPIRVIGGKLYDFSQAMAGSNPGGFNFSAVVFQVMTNGVLVKPIERAYNTQLTDAQNRAANEFAMGGAPSVRGLTFVKTTIGLDGVADGQTIRFWGIPGGTFQYANTGGSTSTVPVIDGGRPYDPKTDQLPECLRLTKAGLIRVPIPQKPAHDATNPPPTQASGK